MREKAVPVLAFVIPCYNEAEMFPHALKKLDQHLDMLIDQQEVSAESFLFFIDDGSKDETWELIAKAHEFNSKVHGLKLSKNVGHQNALLAGMLIVKNDVDCIVSLDADLQDDISIVAKMLEHYREGCEIVYGVRSSRKKDSSFKRNTALLFYKLCGILGLEIKPNHADYRLVSKKALVALEEFKETDLFLRGVFPLMGFKTADITYERKAREHGKTKYPFWKMVSFAWSGITSFSIAPIRLSGIIGMGMLILTFFFFCFILIRYIQGATVHGWTSLVVAILFLGSVQLVCLSIIGEYVGKIYIEMKRRPNFIIDKKI